MKKILAVAMAAELAFGSMGVTAFASSFADIDKVPWSGAAQFIDQAQSVGLMNGYTENGKKYSKPRNNVTLCESVQMIYSIMKVYKKEDVSSADVTKWSTVMSAYNIPSWAYNATAYALENKIIENSDLTKLKNGTQNATREEVGLMFGKALSSVYSVNNSATLSYKDTSKISRNAVPYLALLNSKNLMVGDTNNKFNPSAKINRAEMAVLSVKTYNYLNDSSKAETPTTPTAPTSGTINGTVVNSMILANGDIFLSVAVSGGTGLNLFGKKSSVKVTFEGETVALSDIGTGDTVAVTYSNTDISSVVINKSVKGILTKKSFALKSLSSSKIIVKDGSTETTYRLNDDVDVTIAGSKSTLSRLRDEMEDYDFTATLSFNKVGDVSKIEAMRSKNNPLTGTLSYMNSSRLKIEVGSKEYEYPLSEKDVTIKNDGKTVRFSTLEDEYRSNNYNVTLKLDSKGYVTDIIIDFMEDETHGSLDFINSRRLVLKAGGKTYNYDINSDVDVEIDGKSSKLSTLTDRYENNPYTVALTLDRYDGVSKISATTKNSGLSKGTLKEVSSSKIKITVDGKSYEYDLDNPEIKIDGKKISLSDLKNGYKDYTYEVELTFNSKGEVSGITGKNQKATKGTLKNIEPRRDQIEITAGGVNYTYDFADDIRVTLDGSSSSVSKLDSAFEDANYYKEEIKISLSLDSHDDVTKIEAKTEDADDRDGDTVKGTLKSVGTWDITVKTSSNTKTYDFKSGNVTITLDGKSKDADDLDDALDDLDSDEIITVTLYFNSDDKVSEVVAKTVDEDDAEDKPKKGDLKSVSTSSRRLKIEDSSGHEYEWYCTSGVDVSYSINDDDEYDKRDYTDDLDGLKKFLSHCDRERDDCYVRLTVNSSGDVTDITAEDNN